MKYSEEQLKRISQAAQIELARRSFWQFCKTMMPSFYKDGRKYLEEFCNTLQGFFEGDADYLVINVPPRHGKKIADNTKVLTTNGWKKHGDLQVGDYVYGLDGKPKQITFVHPKTDDYDYTVTFSNGQKIVAHANHEWVVMDAHNYYKPKTVETEWLVGKLEDGGPVGKRGSGYRFVLPEVQYLQNDKKELPIHPYVFGAWLGDGTTTKPCISNDKKDLAIVEKIQKCGYEMSAQWVHRTTGVVTSNFPSLRKDLQKIGLCFTGNNVEKYIPDVYLTASEEDRLELLAGLMDTDGCLRKKEHRYCYSTTNEQIRDALITLLATFNWRSSVICIKVTTSSSGIQGKKDTWQIAFNPDEEIPCVLERKQLKIFSKKRRISIVSVEKNDYITKGNCITVEGGIYLVGEKLVPTHNSMTLQMFTLWMLGKKPESKIMTASYNEMFSTQFAKNVRDTIQAIKADEDIVVYSDVFPETKIKSGDASMSLWSLEGHYNSYLATSPKGTATGMGASLEIFDDIIKNSDEAYNETVKEAHFQWFANTMLSRLERGGKIVVCQTRWSTSDLAGRILKHFRNLGKKVLHVNYKALQDDGSMLCDDILTREDYETRKSTMNPDIFLANYQQELIDVKGSLYTHFKTYDKIPLDGGGTPLFTAYKVQIDTADKGNDYLCAIAYGVYQGNYYVLDVVFTQEPMEITETKVARMIMDNGIKTAKVESNNGGRGFARNVDDLLRNKYHYNGCVVKTFTQTANKVAKILSNSTNVMEHLIMPTDWQVRWREFATQMLTYQKAGKNAHDDAPDCASEIILDNISKGIKINPRILMRTAY